MSIETGLVPVVPLPRREVRSAVTPSRLFGFIWRVSAHDQLWLAVLSVLVFAAGVLPLELQRRIVNSAFVGGSVKTIVGLAGAYVALALSAGLLKLGLNIYRSYVSENAVRWLRTALLDDLCWASRGNHPKETEGVAVSLVLDEAEPIGSFAGVCLSEPLLQGGILVGVFGYMVYLEPLMAILAFAVFCPQLFFVPWMQQAINRRVASRIGLLRQISIGIIGQPDSSAAVRSPQMTRIQEVFALNMGIFKLKFSMNFLMNLMHHLGVAAILAVGGYFVITGRTEIGTVVAFVSGLGQINANRRSLGLIASVRCRSPMPLTRLAILIAGLTILTPAFAQGDPQMGKFLAETDCARCHAIGPTGPSPLPPAPPFRALHTRYPVESLAGTMAEGIVVGHPFMPEFRLDPDQIENLIAYLKTLER